MLNVIITLALKKSQPSQNIHFLTVKLKILENICSVRSSLQTKFSQFVCLITYLSLPSVISLPSPIHQPHSLSLCRFLLPPVLLSLLPLRC